MVNHGGAQYQASGDMTDAQGMVYKRERERGKG